MHIMIKKSATKFELEITLTSRLILIVATALGFLS